MRTYILKEAGTNLVVQELALKGCVMDNNLEIIYKKGRKIVYKIDSCDRITEGFIAQLKWPPEITGLIFVFEQAIVNETQIMAKLPLSIDAGVVYSSSRNSLPAAEEVGNTHVVAAQIKDAEMLARLYLACREKVFAPVAGIRQIPEIDMAVMMAKMRDQLANAKIGYWERSGIPAGAIVVTKWHDYADRPVEWIPWIWIDPNIPLEDRKSLHGLISGWLKANIDGKVQCVVDSYNVRSQKFFKKLGFIPECVHIVK